MIGQWISQARKMVGMQTGARRVALMRVMFCLALCVLIGGMTPTAAAWHANDSILSQRLYAREAAGIRFSDDAEMSWTPAAALPSAIPDVVIPAGPADTWTLAALLVFVLLAAVLIWKGPRPKARLGHVWAVSFIVWTGVET